MCAHIPSCPAAEAADRYTAQVVARADQQGWSRPCNGMIVFDGTGEFLPKGMIGAPQHRLSAEHVAGSRR